MNHTGTETAAARGIQPAQKSEEEDSHVGESEDVRQWPTISRFGAVGQHGIPHKIPSLLLAFHAI
jgi:hypothetical protein